MLVEFPGTDHRLLDNAVWHALGGPDARMAEANDGARRYLHDVSSFAAIDEPTSAAWDALGRLVGPGGVAVLFRVGAGEPPEGWKVLQRGMGHQMIAGTMATTATFPIRALTEADVPRMLALVELTKPGPFLPRTIRLGGYHGVFDGEELIAMAGERMHPPGYTEISAVCTHPAARGRGLAAALTAHVATAVRSRGELPFLHVAQDNHGARRVYEQIGFTTRTMTEVIVARPPRPGSPS